MTTSHEQITGKKPLVNIRINNWIVQEWDGKRIEVICSVAEPVTSIEFTRLDKILGSDTIVEKELDTTKLIFQSFSPSDAGKYRCTATNQFGEHSDVAEIKLDYGKLYTFNTENFKSQSVGINPVGEITEGAQVELVAELTRPFPRRRMRRQLTPPAVDYFTWMKIPYLPRSAEAVDNKLILSEFNDVEDNGMYLVRATLGDQDLYGSRLIASNDFLLRDNEFISIEKADDSYLIVTCRPCKQLTKILLKRLHSFLV